MPTHPRSYSPAAAEKLRLALLALAATAVTPAAAQDVCPVPAGAPPPPPQTDTATGDLPDVIDIGGEEAVEIVTLGEIPEDIEEGGDIGGDFESRLEAARERYSTANLEQRIPDSGLRLQGHLRDVLLPPVRKRLLELAETNDVVVCVDRVLSDPGRTNDVWQCATLCICPDESEIGFERDVVFRLFSRTATPFPEYRDDFETYVFKRAISTGEEEWVEPADWISLPKANITWCGIDLWEIEHVDFRDGLLRRIPFEELFRPAPPPEQRNCPLLPEPAAEDFARAVLALTNCLASVDLATLAEEAKAISEHAPRHDGWPLPDSWLAPFEKALAPVCGERKFRLGSARNPAWEETFWVPFLRADVRIDGTWLKVLFFPFDCAPEPGNPDEPPSDRELAVWPAPFLLVSPGAGISPFP